MQHHDNEYREFPEPETVLAIRGAIATGRMGGPMGEPGHWLNEFWQVGAALRDHAEILQGVQNANRRAFLSTTADYLAASETTSEHAGDRSRPSPSRGQA